MQNVIQTIDQYGGGGGEKVGKGLIRHPEKGIHRGKVGISSSSVGFCLFLVLVVEEKEGLCTETCMVDKEKHTLDT